MIHVQTNEDEEAYPLLWDQRKEENCYPVWEDIQQNDACEMAEREALSSVFHEQADEIMAILLIFHAWISKLFFSFKEEAVWQLSRAKRGVPALRSMFRFPVINKKHVQESMSVIGMRLKHHVTSPEFWLGVTFGVVTRIATKFAIAGAFPDHHVSAMAVGFVACAGAGVAAGMVAYLVRVWYRNSKVRGNEEKEKYWSKALLESAVIGLFGGLVGGCVTNVGAIVAQGGSFAVGATSGVVVSVIHTASKKYWASQELRANNDWGSLIFQGVTLGVVGGVIGVVAPDLLEAHNSIAAPVNEGEGASLYLPPSANPQGLVLSPPSTTIQPVESVVVGTPQSYQPSLVSRPTLVAPLVAKEPVPPLVQPQQQVPIQDPCHKVVHKVRHHHIRHARHIRHIKQPPIVKNIFIIRPPPEMPPPPPLLYIPMPPPVVVDPCATGNCDAPCDISSQLDLKGQCADPNTPCVERVSFNEEGQAKKVVLEPRLGHESRPHFEVERTRLSEVSDWGKAARDVSDDSSADSHLAKVSLVVPFANSAPVPA